MPKIILHPNNRDGWSCDEMYGDIFGDQSQAACA